MPFMESVAVRVLSECLTGQGLSWAFNGFVIVLLSFARPFLRRLGNNGGNNRRAG